jgi:uncharacterized coiled-coil DUF342 family protein
MSDAAAAKSATSPKAGVDATVDVATDAAGAAPTPAASSSSSAATTVAELKVVPRPNDAEVRKQQEKMSRQISEQSDRLKEVKAKLDALTGGPRGPGSGGPGSGASSSAGAPAAAPNPAQAVRDKLKALQKQIREQIDRSKASRAEMDRIEAQKKTALDKVKKMRAELDFTKEEDIDREITKLEERLTHTSMSITEEKKTVSKIGTLRASRRAVGEQAAFSAQIATLDEKRKEVAAHVRTISDGIKKLKEEEAALRTELNKLNDEYKSKRADVPALLKKKDELRKSLSAQIAAQRKFRDDVDRQWAEWKAYKREADRLYREERAARSREDRDGDAPGGRDGAGSDSDADAAPPLGAWAQEITVCSDLVIYLEAIKARAAATKAAAAAPAPAQAAAPAESVEGLEIMGGKRRNNEGGAFINLGQGKNGKGAKGTKGKGKGKKADAAGGAEGGSLSHGLDTMLYFSTIELQPPATFAAIDQSIEEIRARRVHYEADPPKPEKAKPEEGAKKKDGKKKAAAPVNTSKAVGEGAGPSPTAGTPSISGAWANRAK